MSNSTNLLNSITNNDEFICTENESFKLASSFGLTHEEASYLCYFVDLLLFDENDIDIDSLVGEIYPILIRRYGIAGTKVVASKINTLIDKVKENNKKTKQIPLPTKSITFPNLIRYMVQKLKEMNFEC